MDGVVWQAISGKINGVGDGNVKVQVRKSKVYHIEYGVSNNLGGWNGVRKIRIETLSKLNEKEMIDYIIADNRGMVSQYANVTLKSCYLEMTTRSKLL